MVIKMAFKQLRKRRERGERFPVGFIKRKIVLIISVLSPKGIPEPNLHEVLKEEYGVSESKGVKIHLAELEKKKVLIKEEKKGFANVWKLNQDYETFRLLVKEFHNSQDEIEFIKSKYAQSAINEEFVDHFAVDWGKAYANLLSKRALDKVVWGKPLEKLEPDDFKRGFYDCLVSLTKENLIQILCVSHSGLYTFLFPEEALKYKHKFLSLGDYFIFPFVFDVVRYGIPPDKGAEVKLEVNYGDLVTEKGKTSISPSLHGKSEFKIFVTSKPVGSIEIPPKSILVYQTSKRRSNDADNP